MSHVESTIIKACTFFFFKKFFVMVYLAMHSCLDSQASCPQDHILSPQSVKCVVYNTTFTV